MALASDPHVKQLGPPLLQLASIGPRDVPRLRARPLRSSRTAPLLGPCPTVGSPQHARLTQFYDSIFLLAYPTRRLGNRLPFHHLQQPADRQVT